MSGKKKKNLRMIAPKNPKMPVVPVDYGPKCSVGNYASLCCVGTPWAKLADMPGTFGIHNYGEPLSQMVIEVAEHNNVDPHDLDWHLEAIHGFEAHDTGYDNAVLCAVYCLLEAGYRATKNREKCNEA